MACVAVGSLKGHTDTVLCCEVAPSKQQLASGSEDGSLALFDLRTNVQAVRLVPACLGGEPVLSVTHHPKDDTKMFMSSGDRVLGVDLRSVGGEGSENTGDKGIYSSWQVTSNEEVNQVAVDSKGKFLAAADDNGDVTVFDLQKNEVRRMLSGIHSSIASSVSFRPHRPWEVCSGGLDSVMVRWDFSSGKHLQLWDMGGEAVQDGNQMFNPPHVNAIAVPTTDKRPFCRMVAVARGDGSIVVYDADATPRPVKAPGRGSSSKRGSTGPENEARAHGPVKQGLMCCLDRSCGGHTSSAAHVTFPQWASGSQVLSGGNDCRILLWDWQRAEVNTLGDEASKASTQALLCSEHIGSKINWLATRDAGAENLYISNTTEKIAIYSVK
mmetsp:Transcript_2998/g.8468  ORF Transcript_2998/g.8468 Transcript_2998/m.8468 type:complete len:383 (+) Transcript_2998:222-1370(+)|eukprot:CAMPEP_0117666548 /NCGR_PEP_ID=MMETSP0804-20121206/10438_1 /TAXON_ID=1074897 /ORGANISM="Tetraselmis astigmatica, Strain CCMP880" /LENGTH=382 /DNA_ID=CAMNT_0005474107 /DNA_START=165 /DNA_END=1313 /DNA_ORIENTATION=+